MDGLLKLSSTVVSLMWHNWMIVLLVGTGILLTMMTRFIQVRKFVLSIKYLFQGGSRSEKLKNTEGDISPFAALMTALAATVGNGNIAGVAAAIATGGPGAPFWMWISGFFGMATKYAECYLGVKFRKVAEDGSMAGGPMYYCRYGIKNQSLAKIMGMTFAICGGITALLGTGNMIQSNSMALAMKAQFGVPTIVSALVITGLVGIVILGGIKRIGAVAERLVPSMIIFYIAGALVILLIKFTELDDAIRIVVTSAFSLKAAGGALIGTSVQKAISMGVRRGVLSNEAGLGSAAIAQSAAKSPDPRFNGLLGMTGVFIDTILVNTITTLTIMVTGVWKLTPAAGVALIADGTAFAADKIAMLPPQVHEAASQLGYNLAAGGLSSTALSVAAFNSVLPFGGLIIAIGSMLFGYTTLLGWAYYGEQCIGYIWGVKSHTLFRIVFIALLFGGAMMTGKYLDIVWNIGDTFNGVMALPNLIGLLLLSRIVAKSAFEKDQPL
ncbi:sodium:alanine symporter family protein [candidate division KSB1 bacterium]|nr:sodium:alanine symporter family protein [candidate division KSB1 bacterium]